MIFDLAYFSLQPLRMLLGPIKQWQEPWSQYLLCQNEMLFHISRIHFSKLRQAQLCCDTLYLGIYTTETGTSRCQTIETVHLITGRNIFYNLFLILKCFTLGIDHFYVFLHQDVSRKHFRHSSLFRTFYFRPAHSARVWSVLCFPLRLEREITFGEHHIRILRKLRQPHVHCQVFNILLGHMFRSSVNSVPSSIPAGH